jgi:hypothetical protein
MAVALASPLMASLSLSINFARNSLSLKSILYDLRQWHDVIPRLLLTTRTWFNRGLTSVKTEEDVWRSWERPCIFWTFSKCESFVDRWQTVLLLTFQLGQETLYSWPHCPEAARGTMQHHDIPNTSRTALSASLTFKIVTSNENFYLSSTFSSWSSLNVILWDTFSYIVCESHVSGPFHTLQQSIYSRVWFVRVPISAWGEWFLLFRTVKLWVSIS